MQLQYRPGYMIDDVETLFALMTLCEGAGHWWIPPTKRSFDVIFDIGLKKWSRCRRFETTWCWWYFTVMLFFLHCCFINTFLDYRWFAVKMNISFVCDYTLYWPRRAWTGVCMVVIRAVHNKKNISIYFHLFLYTSSLKMLKFRRWSTLYTLAIPCSKRSTKCELTYFVCCFC